jgi:hypothetical protein
MDFDNVSILLVCLLSAILVGAIILMLHFKKQVSFFKKECADLTIQIHYISIDYFANNKNIQKQKVKKTAPLHHYQKEKR